MKATFTIIAKSSVIKLLGSRYNSETKVGGDCRFSITIEGQDNIDRANLELFDMSNNYKIIKYHSNLE